MIGHPTFIIPPTVTIFETKGGVGKSTTATGIALYLSKEYNLKVGLIDVDFCSSNTQQILNLKHKKAKRKRLKTGYELIPRIINPNLKYMGINLVQSKSCTGTQLKGRNQTGFFQMMTTEVNWGNLDCFILDLPAGSDDIFISIPQVIGTSFMGVFLVTQPNTIIDLKKSIELCSVNRFNILGIIENMVGSNCACHNLPAACPACHEPFAPFGRFGDFVVRKLAMKLNIEYCGIIPLTDGDIHKVAEPVFKKTCDIIVKELE